MNKITLNKDDDIGGSQIPVMFAMYLLWHDGTDDERSPVSSQTAEASPTKLYPVSHWNVQTVL